MVGGGAAHEGWQLKMPAVAATYGDLLSLIGEGEGATDIEFHVYKEDNFKRGVQVEGHHPISPLLAGDYKYVVMDIKSPEKQSGSPQLKNVQSELLQLGQEKFRPNRGNSSADSAKANARMHHFICEYMKHPPDEKAELYVAFSSQQAELTTFNRALGSLLLTIDHHHGSLLDTAQQSSCLQHSMQYI